VSCLAARDDSRPAARCWRRRPGAPGGQADRRTGGRPGGWAGGRACGRSVGWCVVDRGGVGVRRRRRGRVAGVACRCRGSVGSWGGWIAGWWGRIGVFRSAGAGVAGCGGWCRARFPNRPYWLFTGACGVPVSLENCRTAAGCSPRLSVIVLMVRGFVALGCQSLAALGVLEERMGA
jgi:hypothetical protein